MKKRIIFIAAANSFFLSSLSRAAWAAPPGGGGGLGCGDGFGPIAQFLCGIGNTTADKEAVGSRLNSVLGGIIGFLTILGGLWFLFQFIIAGYNWISAGGDKGKVEAAQQKITNSLIGLLIVVGAYVIVGLLGKILGLDILNPGKILQGLSL